MKSVPNFRVSILGCSPFLSVISRAANGPTFDVASVKITGPETRPPWLITGGPGTSDPGRFHGPHMTMSALLMRAFGVRIDQIQGPKWITEVTAQTTFYSIDATMPPETTEAQFQQMFQNLLIERFHLVCHRETRGFPGYELVVDAGGPKIKEVTPDPNPVMPTTLPPVGEDGFRVVPGPQTMRIDDRSGRSRTKYQEQSMAEFVSNLGFVIGSSQGKGANQGFPQPRVVDKTGLTGKYTFIFEYYNASIVGASAGFPSPATGTASDPSGAPDIFTAIKKLGLRLQKSADVPLDVILVESLDKIPIEN